MVFSVFTLAMSHDHHGISNYLPMECLFNSLLRLTTKKHQRSALLSTLNLPVISGFPSQWESNMEIASIWWHRNAFSYEIYYLFWLSATIYCNGSSNIHVTSSQIAKFMGPTNGAHLVPVGPRWAPCWPHEPCYLGQYADIMTWKCWLYYWLFVRRNHCSLVDFLSKNTVMCSFEQTVEQSCCQWLETISTHMTSLLWSRIYIAQLAPMSSKPGPNFYLWPTKVSVNSWRH